MWIREEEKEKLNKIIFTNCEGILMGDVLHYCEYKENYLPKDIFKTVIEIMKKSLGRVEIRSVRKGTPKTIGLYAIAAANRKDQEKDFDNVTNLMEDYIICKVYNKHLSLKNIKYLKLLGLWNCQMKLKIEQFGKRIQFLNSMYEVFLNSKAIEESLLNGFTEFESIVVFCDVHPLDCFLVQKFNNEEKTTVTLQHGVFALNSDSWAYGGSKSKYFLLDSKHTVDCALLSGYKGNPIAVGSMHNIGKVFVKRNVNKNDVIGIVCNSEMYPKEDNITMINVVESFCRKNGKKVFIKLHPTNNEEEFEKIIDKKISTICEKNKTIDDFAEDIDLAVISISTVFTAMLFKRIPALLFYRDGFDQNLYLNADDVKFSTPEKLEELVEQINTPKFVELMKKYRDYYLVENNIEESYKKVFKEIGINND